MNLDAVQFIRPAWLLALVLLPMAWFWLDRRRRAAPGLEGLVDAHLLPHLLGARTKRRGAAGAFGAIAYVLAVLALAGPSWRAVEQPLWQTRSPLVLAVDLSSATLATDVAPHRLAQVRARLDTLMRERAEGPVGLVAFAGEAFTVTPVTDDAANVVLFLDALHPEVMPVDGQAVDRAIAWSRSLIERAGFRGGHVVVLTDHADPPALRAAAAARDAGVTVSALGLGDARGASVATPAGGSARVRLDERSLRELAARGGGRYARLANDGSDRAVFERGDAAASTGTRGERMRVDEGARLVPFAMAFALLAWLRAPGLLLLCLVLAVPFRAPASDLWRRPDQQSHRAIVAGVEAYRRGDFRRAAERFAAVDSAVGHYNRGNALARAGALEDAVAAYDEALRRQPDMPDATANRRAVLAALERRKGGQGAQGRPSTARGSQGQARTCPPDDPGCDGREASPQRAQAPATRGPGEGTATRPAEPARQAEADAAQRERMRQALERAPQPSTAQPPDTPAERARKLANDAALQRVRDEPGNLLREKFLLEYERRHGRDAP